MEKIAFCVIAFEPIKIQTHSAPQDDRLNFSFEIHLVFGINHSPHIHDGLTSHPIFQNMLDLTL